MIVFYLIIAVFLSIFAGLMAAFVAIQNKELKERVEGLDDRVCKLEEAIIGIKDYDLKIYYSPPHAISLKDLLQALLDYLEVEYVIQPETKKLVKNKG